MPLSIEKLRKYFRLEHENGYGDTAVIGGLASILSFWEGEARLELLPEDLIQAIAATLRSYKGLTTEERSTALGSLWKQVQAQVPESIPHKETPIVKTASTSPRQIPTQEAPKTASGVSVGDPGQTPAPETPSTEAEGIHQAPPGKAVPAPTGRKSAVQPERPREGISQARPGGNSSKRPIALNAALTVLAGVGPRHAAMLGRLGIHTLGDMLYHFPRRYDDYSALKPIRDLAYDPLVTIIGTVMSTYNRQIRGKGLQIFEVILNDGTGSLRLTFFNQPWLVNRLKKGDAISVSGRVEQYLGRKVMNNPDWEPVEVENLHTNRIVPVYALTQNVTQKWLRKLIHQVVTYWAPKLTDHLPESMREAAGLPDLGTALLHIHAPPSHEKLQTARERLAFDEIFFLQIGVLRQRKTWQSVSARTFNAEDAWVEDRLARLPFKLTAAQQRALDDIRRDLTNGQPMNRLLQGDVGSGKTVIAAFAASIVTAAGAQAAIMAPTSILASQHLATFKDILCFEGGALQPEQVRLLLGDTPEKEREEIRSGLASGQVRILIGTHALLEDPVAFADLQFIVVDEQHRFGVEQRAILRSKGTNPHLLVMTATPIPRSLALTLYGDLDLSVMEEMPAGRLPIPTYILPPNERERGYSLLRSQVEAGHQAFIIYPLIEGGESSDELAATREHDRLSREVFPDLKLQLLHGRMKPAEKEAAMLAFRDRQFDILVSTTVIEVGLDIPNATVMLVEGANRFGLAQLHQLRGRVGRSAAQSYCLLIPDHEDAAENERLQAMVESNDGFVLAERDLAQRGPGEFLGTRQAGYAASLKVASLSDMPLIEKARQHAQDLFGRDPELKETEHAVLAEALARFWGNGRGDVS